MAAPAPFNLGNVMLQAEKINAMRADRDPNSLKNQYLAAKIKSELDPSLGSDPSGVEKEIKFYLYAVDQHKKGNPEYTQEVLDLAKQAIAKRDTFLSDAAATREAIIGQGVSGAKAAGSAQGELLGNQGGNTPFPLQFTPDEVPKPQLNAGGANFELSGAQPVIPSKAAQEAQIAGEVEKAKVTKRAEAEAALPENVAKAEMEFYENANALETIDALLSPKSDKDKMARLDYAYGRKNLASDFVKPTDWVDAEAERDQIVSMLQLAAAGKLKGQGQITENERAMLARAATFLGNPLISSELAERELRRVRAIFKRARDRAAVRGNVEKPDSGADNDPLGIR